MKQTAFDTRQRAAELLQEAVNIWRQSDHSDQLEGIERDPIFSLLITALAYQANEIDGDIERMKQDVLEEFSRLLMPYESGRPIPASTVVEVALQNHVPEAELTQQSSFYLENSNYQFMPLLRSRVINATVTKLIRLDGRRWQVTLKFQAPVTDLTGMTFAVMDNRFQDVRVSVNGHHLPLVKPWQYADMPLQPCFSVDSLLYNQAQLYNASMTGLDLFARQNVALFSVKKYPVETIIPFETGSIDMVFDFKGIPDNFVFDKSHLILNAVILVNAKLSTANLSTATPMVRISGYSADTPDNNQLMHLIPPSAEQLFGKTPVEVRRVSADRFNLASLIKLVNSLTTKIHSDYYAFLQLRSAGLSDVIHNLQDSLLKLSRAVRNDQIHSIPGVYLLINRQALTSTPFVSLDVSYLTTVGSAVNQSLQPESRFVPPVGFDASATRQIVAPLPGFDEANDSESSQNNLRYQMITNDRIVTPADMKILCYTELANRYSIVPAMVSNISVRYGQQLDRADCGYAFWVEIRLQDNPFVKRSFFDKIPQAELYLQKRMEVRSSCIYPIYVNIQMETATI